MQMVHDLQFDVQLLVPSFSYDNATQTRVCIGISVGNVRA